MDIVHPHAEQAPAFPIPPSVHYIYVLRDPRDQSVRYVGRTGLLHQRHQYHSHNYEVKTRRGLWVSELIALGMIPDMYVIDSCDEPESSSREAYWIARYHVFTQGNLTNDFLVPQSMEDAYKLLRSAFYEEVSINVSALEDSLDGAKTVIFPFDFDDSIPGDFEAKKREWTQASTSFGEWIERNRIVEGFSQHKIAKEAGVTQSTLSDIESGKRGIENRSLRAARKVIAALGISLLEAYHRAGLLQTTDERDQDAIEAALLIRQMQPRQRAEALSMLREKLREG